jgi:hypothetical protein
VKMVFRLSGSWCCVVVVGVAFVICKDAWNGFIGMINSRILTSVIDNLAFLFEELIVT